MTTGSLLTALGRRWYIVLLGLAVTAAAAVQVHGHEGAYWSQVDVVFLAPKSPRYPNSIEETSGSVTAMAGLVESEMNKGIKVPATSSAGATLAGAGVRDGYLIRLPNSGGQWAMDFDRPVLDVQVIGPNSTTVRARLAALVEQIDQVLFDLQNRDDIRRRDFITIASAPTEAQVFYMNGNPTRALSVVVLLGLCLTAAAATGVDAGLSRQAARRRRRMD